MSDRRIRIEGEIAYVPLTRGYEAVIDAADVPLVEGISWFALLKPRNVYAYCTQRNTGSKKTVYMHRLILGNPEGLDVDHINCDALDNRRCNLRQATRSQNNYNARKRNRDISGYKGVFWRASRQKWCAEINHQGKKVQRGGFATAEDAFAAYAKLSAELHGEYGRVE